MGGSLHLWSSEKGTNNPDPWWCRRCWRQCGAAVIAAASGDEEAHVKSIGASRVITIEKCSLRRSCERRSTRSSTWPVATHKKWSFLVLREGGHHMAATQLVSQEEAARHRVSGTMKMLAPSPDMLGRIARLLEDGTIRPDVSRSCTHSRMRPRLGRTSPGNCHGFVGCRLVGRERQEAGHTARPCFVWPRHLQAFEQAFSGRIRGGAVQAETMIDGLLWRTSALKMEYES